MNKVYIIAEAGVNHNGSLQIAKDLVEEAARAGADAVKFQTFFSENLVTKSAPKARYQERNSKSDSSQYDMLKVLELSRDAHFELKDYAENAGIEFLSTPFGLEELDFLVRDVKVQKLKMSSGEITNGMLLLEAARSQLPIIFSTGMSTVEEISDALGVLAFGYLSSQGESPRMEAFRAARESERGIEMLEKKVTILHCTTQYPTPFDQVNLRAMGTLAKHFGLPVGYSDHTEGIMASIAAAANGATVIEKHFTLDRGMEGPDHAASIEPHDLQKLVAGVRDVERLMGLPTKVCNDAEGENLNVVRKSLVVKRNIRSGEEFTAADVTAKRPGGGLSPMAIWDILGRKSNRDYLEDEMIDTSVLEDQI
ncbi:MULTISPECIES: N-acetylneuraminate synthase [Thalassospira]|uniref:AFP-like domain-containing protein n=2 Tax=Thalassospira tepidiphila TaxID=393657 RepID=A0A853L4Z0_9PROT|nr:MULTISPECIES: N-acetylneuraminate synthase [Thalassospira]MBE72347.1 N-acetylneuraminate synthase [Thalassospira sp.]MBO6577952.1 N-acetylneuraminate synthase [Thalassospira sp.]MBO6817254.1 N-acetylneuraminate synthase [Thalassospira sp.]MBO6890004.1 N-acetylneuraminate synthase [Thalassospira sp.]NJB73901.1 N-acetylneuraminate synthase [Thalassospira tepidiphila]|tara:strand:- start:401 stop:1501 length:1101 start_codon:yes stop_codon:yes gene_type:complete